MNNNFFSLKRFGMVLSKDIKSIISNSGTTILAFLGGYLLYFLLCLFIGGDFNKVPSDRFPIATLFLFVGVYMLPFSLFPKTNDAKYGIHFAMLPASTLEKYLSMVICTLTTVIVYVLLFCSFDSFLALFPIEGGFSGTFFTDDILFNDVTLKFMGILLLFVSGLIYGNVTFKKHKPSKTMLLAVIVNTVLIILAVCTVYLFGWNSDSFNVSFEEGVVVSGLDNINLKKIIITVCLYLYIFGLPLLLFILSFFRIKNQKY